MIHMNRVYSHDSQKYEYIKYFLKLWIKQIEILFYCYTLFKKEIRSKTLLSLFILIDRIKEM